MRGRGNETIIVRSGVDAEGRHCATPMNLIAEQTAVAHSEETRYFDPEFLIETLDLLVTRQFLKLQLLEDNWVMTHTKNESKSHTELAIIVFWIMHLKFNAVKCFQ